MKAAQSLDREEIASGGFARIFCKPGELVAEKELLPKYQGRLEYENLQRREFEILSSLKGKKFPEVYQLKMESPRPGVITHILEMQLLSGPSMADYLAIIDSCSEAVRIQLSRFFLREIGDVFESLRNAYVIHADLSPENILFDENSNLYLIDFGSSVYVHEPQHPNFLRMAGKPSYRAPEIREGAPHTYESDLYSVGRILEEILGPYSLIDCQGRDCVRMLLEERTLPDLDFSGLSVALPNFPIKEQKPSLQIVKTQELRKRSSPTNPLLRVAGLGFCWFGFSTFQFVGMLQLNTLPRTMVCIEGTELCFGETPLQKVLFPPGQIHLEFRVPGSKKVLFERNLVLQKSQTLKFFEDYRNTDTL